MTFAVTGITGITGAGLLTTQPQVQSNAMPLIFLTPSLKLRCGKQQLEC